MEFLLLNSKYLSDCEVIGKIENVTQRSSCAAAEGNDKILINWKSPSDQEWECCVIPRDKWIEKFYGMEAVVSVCG